jgi:hypothetical protein
VETGQSAQTVLFPHCNQDSPSLSFKHTSELADNQCPRHAPSTLLADGSTT